jgi:hypothetical protein
MANQHHHHQAQKSPTGVGPKDLSTPAVDFQQERTLQRQQKALDEQREMHEMQMMQMQQAPRHQQEMAYQNRADDADDVACKRAGKGGADAGLEISEKPVYADLGAILAELRTGYCVWILRMGMGRKLEMQPC